MGVGVDMLLVRGRYTMGRCVHIAWVGGRYAIDRGVNVP